MANSDTHIPSTEDHLDETDGHRIRWANGTQSTPVSAVVRAVADLNECDPLELPPLIDSIDPDVLNQLFPSETASSVDRLVFSYCGYEVTVGQTEIRLRSQGEA
ncbi:HalOD1 output domain-containing protein [Halomontanus rarus]|uniref:HalOD1 output domain-containing protein n=1 Tax=Halomontanus rarus TaxID=3034020 RepID=UPI0023E7EEF5|nr:HalOD1 output domain-containing protein [Halovivax sp. TS33]